MKKPSIIALAAISCSLMSFSWGFYAHQKINRTAVFTLPPDMIGFYKKNIDYLTESAVNPDLRRLSVPEEAPRHYIDIDYYGDSSVYKMPRYWNDAVNQYTEDTLSAYGILPWHVNTMYYRLKEAFLLKDPHRILLVSAELGHYLADANVPLHTTENYNGQLTGQEGIHAFWESRLPELFAEQYDFFVGRAEHLSRPQLAVWKAIESANRAVDSVLLFEKSLAKKMAGKRYSFETKGKQTVKVYSKEYAHAYHEMLSGMVQRQMRAAVKLTGDFWYTAWVDAGQPDLKSLIDYQPSEAELTKRKEELKQWREQTLKLKDHSHE